METVDEVKTTIQIADVIPKYIALRDHIKSLEQQHKEQLKPLKEKLEFLDSWMLGELDRRGEDSVAVRGVGTVFRKTESRCSVADWEVVWGWMESNQRFDMLNHAVNKTTVAEHVKETGSPPPGVNYTSTFTVEVNRARGT